MVRHGKKYQEAVKLLDGTKAYHPREAIELAKKERILKTIHLTHDMLGHLDVDGYAPISCVASALTYRFLQNELQNLSFYT